MRNEEDRLDFSSLSKGLVELCLDDDKIELVEEEDRYEFLGLDVVFREGFVRLIALKLLLLAPLLQPLDEEFNAVGKFVELALK